MATPTTRDRAGEIYNVPALMDILSVFVDSLDPLVRAGVQRVAVTGVGESGGLVRPDLSLASPMILWHDQRGVDHLARLTPADKTLVYQTTGLPVNGNYGLSKAAWAIDQLDGRAGNAQWLNIAEFLAARLTGERWSEPTLASRTMALNLSTAEWSAEVCGLVGVDPSVFPGLRPAGDGVQIAAGPARRLGLDPAVRVHVAGHDHMVGAVGADLDSDELLNSTGTTEGLLFLRSAPRLDEHAERAKLANGLACRAGAFTLFASIPTGGSAFATLQTMLGMDADRLAACLADLHDRYLADRIDIEAAPLVLPQFRGSPPPNKDHAARGVISGLRTDTGPEEIVFGCFLGMTLQFGDVLDLFEAQTSKAKVIGPASKNKLWLQLKADLLGVPLSVSRFPEVVSRGAQAIASDSVGDWADRRAIRASCPTTDGTSGCGRGRTTVEAQWQHLKELPARAVLSSGTRERQGDDAGGRDRLVDPELQGHRARPRHRGAGPLRRRRRIRLPPSSIPNAWWDALLNAVQLRRWSRATSSPCPSAVSSTRRSSWRADGLPVCDVTAVERSSGHTST